MTGDRLPYERRSGESAVAFEGFARYRDLGPARSTAKVAQELGKSRTIVDRWSARWRWVARAEAYDRDRDAELLIAQRQAILDMAERHARVATAMQAKVVDRLQKLDVDKLSPRDLAYWFEVSVKVERQARGVADLVRLEHSGPEGGPVQVEINVTDDELLQELAQIQAELDTRTNGQAEADEIRRLVSGTGAGDE